MTTERYKETTNRPYPPPSNVTAVLQRLRTRNLPEQIDSEYLRAASIPDGTVSRTLFAMRFLGLIGGAGELTEPLKAIHTSTDEEYREIISGLIREAYNEVFNVVDPAQDSQDKILNVFRRYTPASQRGRMVIFFLGMCREAGIPTLDVPKARGMTAQSAKQPAKREAARAGAAPQRKKVEVLAGIDPAVEGLVRALPPPGEPLSEERRKQWLNMAEATLKFVYPEVETPYISEDIPADEKETKE